MHCSAPCFIPWYAAKIRGQAPAPIDVSIWQGRAAHCAYLQERLAPAAVETPTDTATIARRAWPLTTTPTGRDGTALIPTVSFAVFVTLTRAARTRPWRVANVTTGS